jgi:hypothetical protein
LLNAPRKPAPAWLTDIAIRSRFRPFGSFTLKRCAPDELSATRFRVTHCPNEFKRWTWMDRRANLRSGTVLTTNQPPIRRKLMLGATPIIATTDSRLPQRAL